jgi:hypothetical protein
MTIQEALTHPNVTHFELRGLVSKVTNDQELIELVRNKPKDVRVFAVLDSGNAAEIWS